jgi:hypothetical protein
MKTAGERSSNGLRLSAKLLGIGYLVYAASMLVFGAFRLISFVNLLSQQHASVNPLVVISFVLFAILRLLLVAASAAIGPRLLAEKRNWPTWTLACVLLLGFPVGTILGVLTLIWLRFARRAEQKPASSEELG